MSDKPARISNVAFTARSRNKLVKRSLDLLESWGIDDLDVIHELHIAALNKPGKTDREKAIKRFLALAMK